MEAGQLRKGFHRELDEIDAKVSQLFALVTETVAAANEIILSGDGEGARELRERDSIIDNLFADIEELVERSMMLQAPVASEFRYLLSVLRIVPELERSGDLAEHIAQRGRLGIADDLTPRARGLVQQLGELVVEMWRGAAEAFGDRDPQASARLDELDDEVDQRCADLTEELLRKDIPRPAAIEMTLVARFYERLGDHSVHISERVARVHGD